MPAPKPSEPRSDDRAEYGPERHRDQGPDQDLCRLGNQPAAAGAEGAQPVGPAGSIFGLLGPNGAGKSTTINILAGLVRKTAGQVTIWGFDQDVNPRQSRAAIGVMPQELNIDPFLAPRASLEVQAGLYGVPEIRTLDG